MANSIGARLREERSRLGLDQVQFAQSGGVKVVAQSNYENDKRSPDAQYLASVAALGVDVHYVLTGTRGIAADDLATELKRMADAWETLERALAHVGRTLTPEKKRKAAEALYQASKNETDGRRIEQLTDLVLQLAA